MDALSSISPFSRHPESRHDPRGLVPAFFINSPDLDRSSAERSTTGVSSQPPEPHAPLAEACSLASGPAWPTSEVRVRELLAIYPSIGAAAQVWHDERGAPIQALPALACAAIKGADPEGWALGLAHLGASFDTRQARSEARAELVGMASPRGGRLSAINARLDALSLWILACAEADHPHSAIRAIEAVREHHPLLLGPLASELSRFSDPRHMDKPAISADARAGAFVEAALRLDIFYSKLLPVWARGPRNGDLSVIAAPLADIISSEEARELAAALSDAPSDAAGAMALFRAIRASAA